MDATLIALHAAVFAAALLQAATGIGFGVIAGPIILMVMNSGAAVQVTILLSLLIAVVLAPSLYGQVHKKVLGGRVLDGGQFAFELLDHPAMIPIGIMLAQQKEFQ